MDFSNSDAESSDGEDWKSKIYQERIDFDWLNYNPHAFFPLEDYFYRTGSFSKVKVEEKQPSQDWSPTFLIGCGRSGTTILAKILSAHPDLCFLNEPRSLWMHVFPEFDVWSAQAVARKGSLKMSGSLDSISRERIASSLYSITEMLGRTSLLEKTPENTFRLNWLDSLFPKSKFIMIKRNPIQTARSISRFQPDTWFGFDQYKWTQLLEILHEFKDQLTLSEEYLTHAENCVFAKALVEWALSTLSAEKFKAGLSKEQRKQRFFEVHLESVIKDPMGVLPKILKFVGLSQNEEVYGLAKNLLHRDLTFSMGHDTLHEHYNATGVNEEALLAMAGPDLRNLIFLHSYHH